MALEWLTQTSIIKLQLFHVFPRKRDSPMEQRSSYELLGKADKNFYKKLSTNADLKQNPTDVHTVRKTYVKT